MNSHDNHDGIVSLGAEIISAYVANNPVPMSELPALIANIHNALTALGSEPAPAQPEPQKPAVPIKKSVHDDFIVCLEDGMKFRSMKRHLTTHHAMTPAEYREKWKLPGDYPMVAPSYAAKRSALAKKTGLGRKAKEAPKPPAKRGRKKATAV